MDLGIPWICTFLDSYVAELLRGLVEGQVGSEAASVRVISGIDLDK